jgi:hypothetical protein
MKVQGGADGPVMVGNMQFNTTTTNYADIDNYKVDNEPITTELLVTKTTAASYTIGTTDTNECFGGIVYATGGGIDVTACDDLDPGMSFTVIVVGDVQVDLDVQSDNDMTLDGTDLDNGDKAVNPAASQSGSMIVCAYLDSDSWYCASGSNAGTLWSDGG